MNDTYKATCSVNIPFPKGSRDRHLHTVEYLFQEKGPSVIMMVRRGEGTNLLRVFEKEEIQEAFGPYVRLHRAGIDTQPGQAK